MNRRQQKKTEQEMAELEVDAEMAPTAGEPGEDKTQVYPETAPMETAEPVTDISAGVQPQEVVREVTPLYSVDGYIPDESLQTYLYEELRGAGIEYFMPCAVCLIAQESDWNPIAENPNGRDKGLLQYRVEYVPWMDWRNPYQQIEYFVAQMANRAAAGCMVSEMISRHNTSDYGSYNQSYVDAVMNHSNTLVRIR